MRLSNAPVKEAAESDSVVLSRKEFDEIKGELLYLDEEMTRLLSQPLIYATVVKADNKFDISAYEKGDRILVLDRELRKKKKLYGKIVSVEKDGWLVVGFSGGGQERLNIGLNGIPQAKLVGKDDGMNVVIAFDGKLFEVHGLPGTVFRPSDTVRVDLETKQIHSGTGISSAGDVTYVKGIIDPQHIEVESGGESRVVIYGLEQKIEPSDRVLLDNSSTVVVRVLERDGKDRFNLRAQSNTTWDQIAGLEDAKEHLIEALELPYQYPEVYKFYGAKPPKGVLLYGAPGCGKTLCGKAAASSLARIHGKDNFQSGFIYVKGPELLSKWVGQAEKEIRQLFARGREHHERHGYPALLFIDEADAILPVRGSGKSSDVENTIVPQFLSEMDGLEDNYVQILLATNQAKRLDPAATREGRIDRIVKIGRPTAKNAPDYFRIHMKDMPVIGNSVEELVQVGTKEIFSAARVLFRVSHKNSEEVFRLSDALTGAMIAGIVAQAKAIAMKRDLLSGKKSRGVGVEDVKKSIDNHYVQNAGRNLEFDLEDFCERLGYERKATSVEKLQLAI